MEEDAYETLFYKTYTCNKDGTLIGHASNEHGDPYIVKTEEIIARAKRRQQETVRREKEQKQLDRQAAAYIRKLERGDI